MGIGAGTYHMIVNKLDMEIEIFEVFEDFLFRLHRINIAEKRNRFTIEEIEEKEMYAVLYALVHAGEALYPKYEVIFHHVEE